MKEHSIARILGGQKMLGRRVTLTLDFHFLILEGFSLSIRDHVKLTLGLSDDQMDGLLKISSRKLNRLRETGQRLPKLCSDRLYRLARIYTLTCVVIGNKKGALKWLRKANPALCGKTPFELIQTYVGAIAVEDLLWQIHDSKGHSGD